MDKANLIKYFKKQLYCPVCSTKLNFKFDSRIDHISGRCNNIKYYEDISYHIYDYRSVTNTYSKPFGFGIDVRLTKDNYHVECDFDDLADSYEIKVFTKEEKNKQENYYWDRTDQYIAVPCITKEIYEPREYYGFLSKVFKKLKVFE